MRAQKICSPQILSPIGTYNLMTEFSTKITSLNNNIISSECLLLNTNAPRRYDTGYNQYISSHIVVYGP